MRLGNNIRSVTNSIVKRLKLDTDNYAHSATSSKITQQEDLSLPYIFARAKRSTMYEMKSITIQSVERSQVKQCIHFISSPRHLFPISRLTSCIDVDKKPPFQHRGYGVGVSRLLCIVHSERRHLQKARGSNPRVSRLFFFATRFQSFFFFAVLFSLGGAVGCVGAWGLEHVDTWDEKDRMKRGGKGRKFSKGL